ncbi:MAG TPA: beta-phosphoglucomutase family hydrolase [Drouetiella sp.]
MAKQAKKKTVAKANAKKIMPEYFDAVLFDMDGVVTRTATVHFAAWKKTFDNLLKEQNKGGDFKEFTQQDYLDYVDGKPREDGVTSFLKSRNIKLPEGTMHDKPGAATVVALGRDKDKEFLHLVHTNGVEPYETTVSLIKNLRHAGIKTALVTASKNGAEILKVTKLASLFDATVTGVDAAKMHLRGKPKPDVFLEAAKRLKVKPSRAVVVEDAEAGVAAGHNGHFGLIVGVARQNNIEALLKHGADVAVRDLGEMTGGEQGDADFRGMTLADLDVTEGNWVVSYDQYDPAHEMQRESLCSLGNGKFCTRGASFESRANDIHYPGTYVAGSYDTIRIDVDDQSPFEREELVNMPNWLCLNFQIDGGEWFSIDDVEIQRFSQRLNLREGILYRDVDFKDKQGRETQLRERRYVHMRYSHVAGIELGVTAVNWSGKLTMRSGIDSSIVNSGDDIDERFKNLKHLETLDKIADKDCVVLKVITGDTRIVVAMGARTSFSVGDLPIESSRLDIIEDEYVGQEVTVDLSQSQTLKTQKVVAMFTSRDRGMYEPMHSAMEVVKDAPGFDDLLVCHLRAWRSLWRQFDLFIETDEENSKLIPSLLLHLNSFHCLQTASMHTVDLDTGVPARGWSGEGYQGHVFWDELFVFPFINLRMPNISAALLKYRYRRLPEARKIAKRMGATGACFPWQSASDGKERTPDYWWQAAEKKWIRDYTHLEIHVNGAVAYNVWSYYQVTADDDFMYSYGSEILLEIARFFASFAKYNKEHDRYEILGVIGPDEFHNGYPDFKEPGLKNNAYTNIIAAWTISHALELLDKMPEDHRQHVRSRLRLLDEELELWEQVRTKLYVPVMKNGIIEQFEGYEELKEFPTKDGRIDLDEMAHQLRLNGGYLNQYKVSKQADILMLGMLFTQCELETLFKEMGLSKDLANLHELAEYYIPRTANQSTLSRVAHTWVLSRLERMSASRKAELLGECKEDEVFYEALGSDYYDVASRGTTRTGIHMGAMAGTVDIVQRCYTGISTRDDVLWFDPLLPKQLVRLSFTLHYRGQSLSVDLHQDQMTVHARHSTAMPIKVGYDGKVMTLNEGDTKVVKLRKIGPPKSSKHDTECGDSSTEKKNSKRDKNDRGKNEHKKNSKSSRATASQTAKKISDAKHSSTSMKGKGTPVATKR